MACRKAFDLDLVACLLDRDRPEWQAFRDHYPRCTECAAEVHTWTELHTQLEPEHPDAGMLLAYEDQPSQLASAERRRIADHLTSCAPCRDEIGTLRHTDIPTLVRTEMTVRPPTRRWFPSLRGLLLNPAFAYGVVLLILAPVAWPYLREQLAPSREQAAANAPRSSVAPRPSVATGDAPSELAVPAAKQEALFERAPVRADEQDVAVALGAIEQRREAFAEPDVAQDARETAALRDAARPGVARGRSLAAFDEAPARAFAKTKRAAAPAPVEWPSVTLDPQVDTLASVTGPGLIVRMAVPSTALTAGLAELRVQDNSRTREIREQHFGPPTHLAEIRLPAGWLTPGTYRVELFVGGDTPVATARLMVAPPRP